MRTMEKRAMKVDEVDFKSATNSSYPEMHVTSQCNFTALSPKS